jgi:sec-independent protein translocase protein TatC
MSFLDHLEELRTRLIRCALAVAAGMAVAFLFIEQLVNFVLEPARLALPKGTTLVFTQSGEGFSLYIDVALLAGVLLSAPVIFYHVWRFIAPGLYATEKRFAVPFVLLTSGGAVAGAAFGHYVFFPSMLAFFGTFSSPDLLFLPRVSDVFGLYLKMLGGLALVFQMPTFAFFLTRMGLVTARWLWHHLKYAILVIFIAAAVLTPSADPWNQIFFAVPMLGLYFLSIAIAWLVAPRRAGRVNRDGEQAAAGHRPTAPGTRPASPQAVSNRNPRTP